MIDRWDVRECPNCKRIWPPGKTTCQFCNGWLPAESFEVVRAVGARSTDPSTSRHAALQKAPSLLSKRGRILAFIKTNGPATSREIEQALEINGAWKRVSELKQGGHLAAIATKHDDLTDTDVTVYGLPTDRPTDVRLF